MGAGTRWIAPQWTAMGLAEANFWRLCSVFIGREEHPLWYTYIYIFIIFIFIYLYPWIIYIHVIKEFRQEHQDSPQMVELKVFFFVFHSELVHNSTAYDLACSVLLGLSGEIWSYSCPYPALPTCLEVTPMHNAKMLKSFPNPHTFLHYLFVDQWCALHKLALAYIPLGRLSGLRVPSSIQNMIWGHFIRRYPWETQVAKRRNTQHTWK